MRRLLPVLLALAAPARADEVPTDTTTRVSLDDDADGPSRGPRDALVTVEFFCNYAHFQCVHAERALHRLFERHPDSLRVVYHLVVLPFHDSEDVAGATIEIWRQGRFAAFADAVAARAAPVRLRELDALASQAGVDVGALHAALATHRHAARLEADSAAREQLGVPTFGAAWNGEPSADLSAEGMERMYRAARERAADLAASGMPRDRVYASLLREAAAARGAASHRPADTPRLRVNAGAAPSRGPADAPVTIVVFTEYQCGYCRRQEETLRRLAAAYPERVRLVWKHFPQPQHRASRIAAEVAACAHAQGGFFRVHDALVQDGAHDVDALVARAGLDARRFRDDAAAGRCAAAVDADIAEGKELGVETTPTTFVNGVKLVGLRGLGELRALVEDEAAPGVLSRVLDAP